MSEVRKRKEARIYAHEKLEEALYFLYQMRLKYVDRKEFIYNMNAFLNSARNVTFVLRKEFAGNTSFETWYSNKQKEMAKDELMKFFVDMRNVSIKVGTPGHSVSLKVFYIIPEDEKTDVFGHTDGKIFSNEKSRDYRLIVPSYDKKDMRPKPKILAPAYSLVTSWKFEKAPEGYRARDILGLCMAYYMKLEQLIAEAEQTEGIGYEWEKEE